jgi:hypothetical protein
MTCKGRGRKRSWPIVRYYPGTCPEELRKTSVRTEGLQDEIRTRDLPNTKQGCKQLGPDAPFAAAMCRFCYCRRADVSGKLHGTERLLSAVSGSHGRDSEVTCPVGRCAAWCNRSLSTFQRSCSETSVKPVPDCSVQNYRHCVKEKSQRVSKPSAEKRNISSENLANRSSHRQSVCPR